MSIRYLLCVLISVLMVACTAPQTRALYQQQATLKQRPAVELHTVPFFAQDLHQCGPAALATMLQHTGVDILPNNWLLKYMSPNVKAALALRWSPVPVNMAV